MSEVLERGDIFFFYRPRVRVEEVRDLSDVQRFFVVLRPDGADGHTHLAYALELPREIGDAQRQLNIRPEASYIVAVRNPEAPTPPGVGLQDSRRAEFPPELEERFRGRRFAPLDPPTFLDHEGAEIVLIGAATEASSELGIDLDTEAERLEDADIFHALHLAPDELPVEPLRSGKLR